MNTPLTFESFEKMFREHEVAELAQPILFFHCRQEVINLAIANNIDWETIEDMERTGKLVYREEIPAGTCMKLDPASFGEWWQT